MKTKVLAVLLFAICLTGCGNKEIEKARLALEQAKSLEAAKEAEQKKLQTELAILQTKNLHEQTLMDKKYEQEIKLEKLRGEQEAAQQERELKQRELRQAYYAQLSENAKPILLCVVFSIAGIVIFFYGFRSSEVIAAKFGEIRVRLAEEQSKQHEAEQFRLLEQHKFSVDTEFQAQRQKFLVLWENWDRLSEEQQRHCLGFMTGAEIPKAIA